MEVEYTYWEDETHEQKQDRLRLLPFKGSNITLLDKSGNESDGEYDLLQVMPYSVGDIITSHDRSYKIVEIDWCLDNQIQYITAHKFNRN